MDKELREEIEKYIDVILSMSMDYKMGKISMETYVTNLSWMAKKFKEETETKL